MNYIPKPPPPPEIQDPCAPYPKMIMGMEVANFWAFIGFLLLLLGIWLGVIFGVK